MPGKRTSGTGPILRTKVSQLVDYFRALIQRGELVEPLPASRTWSQQLGVSRRTLNGALQELQRQRLIVIGKRGARIDVTPTRSLPRRGRASRVVRVLLFGGYRRQNHIETFSLLQERLQSHGLELRWEICSPARLREIARRVPPPGELLLLASIPSVYQRLFAEAGQPALVLGEVAAGLSLPFINVDQAGAVRHATFRLLRRGFSQVCLVHVDLDSVGVKSALAEFTSACRGWPTQPVIASLFATHLDQQGLATTARRLASGVQERRGIIVVAPVPIGMIVTALLHHGIAIPGQVEVVALFHSTESVKLYSPVTYYRSPVATVAKYLASSAVQFFETTRLPTITKTFSAEIARVE